MTTRDELAEGLVRLGLDRAASLIADLIAEADVEQMPDGWLDGVEDALCKLVQAGAADPR